MFSYDQTQQYKQKMQYQLCSYQTYRLTARNLSVSVVCKVSKIQYALAINLTWREMSDECLQCYYFTTYINFTSYKEKTTTQLRLPIIIYNTHLPVFPRTSSLQDFSNYCEQSKSDQRPVEC